MELIFIYNAGSGFFNKISDYTHKIVSPSTYSCSLCMLTYGANTIKDEWQDFLDSIPYEQTFYHKDDVRPGINLPAELPVILINRNDRIKILVSSAELKELSSLNELIKLMTNRIDSEISDNQ